MDWTPERKKRIYDEYTVQEWANWVFGMEDVGWGCMTKQEWRDWVHDMGQEHGMPAKGLGSPQSDMEEWDARARPAQGQPAQGPSFGNLRILEYVGSILKYVDDRQDKTEEGTHSQSSHEPLRATQDDKTEGAPAKARPPAKGKRRVRCEGSESETEPRRNWRTERLPHRNWRTDTRLFTGDAECRICEMVWVCDGNQRFAGHTFSIPVWHVPFFVCPECSN